jgi:hypothetical protein
LSISPLPCECTSSPYFVKPELLRSSSDVFRAMIMVGPTKLPSDATDLWDKAYPRLGIHIEDCHIFRACQLATGHGEAGHPLWAQPSEFLVIFLIERRPGLTMPSSCCTIEKSCPVNRLKRINKQINIYANTPLSFDCHPARS